MVTVIFLDFSPSWVSLWILIDSVYISQVQSLFLVQILWSMSNGGLSSWLLCSFKSTLLVIESFLASCCRKVSQIHLCLPRPSSALNPFVQEMLVPFGEEKPLAIMITFGWCKSNAGFCYYFQWQNVYNFPGHHNSKIKIPRGHIATGTAALSMLTLRLMITVKDIWRSPFQDQRNSSIMLSGT